MNRRIISFVLVGALIATICPANAVPPRKGFLWRVVNAPAPFYLVGSMHALRRDDYPADLDEINRAIYQSQKFIYERDPKANDQTLLAQRLNAQAAYPRGVTIQQRVSPSTFALLKRI